MVSTSVAGMLPDEVALCPTKRAALCAASDETPGLAALFPEGLFQLLRDALLDFTAVCEIAHASLHRVSKELWVCYVEVSRCWYTLCKLVVSLCLVRRLWYTPRMRCNKIFESLHRAPTGVGGRHALGDVHFVVEKPLLTSCPLPNCLVQQVVHT